MHPFPIGTKVETNKEYFNKFGRRVVGETVALDPMPPEEITVVMWLHQEGNVIDAHQGNAVVMLTQDLQLHLPN